MITKEKVKVKKVIYYNPQSSWGVFAIPNEDKDPDFPLKKDIVVSGNFEGVYEDCLLSFTAEVTDHPKYGKQLQLQHYKVIEDTSSRESIVNFLTKSTISGIRTQLANKIYDEFKENSIHIVLRETEKLKKIKGIGHKTYLVVKESVDKYKQMEELLNYCAQIGLKRYSLIMTIYQEFGDTAVSLLKENPYQLLLLSDSLSFVQVDEIAKKAGIKPDDDNRLIFGLQYVLTRESILQGSTGCTDQQLKRVFLKTLCLDNVQYYRYAVTQAAKSESIIRDENNIFLKKFYLAEKNISKKLQKLNQDITQHYEKAVIDEEMHAFPFELNEEQVNAINSCLHHQFSVITSAAGCGKTSISKAIINILARHHQNIILLSPTAKAAKRLNECTGHSASTIHKFLKIKNAALEQSEEVHVPTNSTIIIDEASMLDVCLFEKLLQAVANDTRLILVGDTNQLPSVQAGNLLEDIIQSEQFNICYLTDITRQSDSSNIIKYSTGVNQGDYIPLGLKTHDLQCLNVRMEQREALIEALAPIYAKTVEKYGLLNTQVICAYKQGVLGVNNINKVLKSVMQSEREQQTTDVSTEEIFPYSIGDKVRHTINNYKLDVFNGETGIVMDIINALDEENEQTKDLLIVDYGDRYVTYDRYTASELTLSYASTVHASQGSEYDAVFVILDNEISNALLIRKIVYTAITRAKKKCYILNVEGCVNTAISNNYYRERLTKLCDFLRGDKDTEWVQS